MNRRDFVKGTLAVSALAALRPSIAEAGSSAGAADPLVGKVWPGWTPGHFQLHVIYTGAAESMFLIYPDGTTMLLDCGGHAAINRGKLAVPVLPSGRRLAGEWVARYIERVNPHKTEVDYLVVSHFHSDHTGCEAFHAGRTQGRGEDYFLSGIAQVAETIRFKKAIDRGWPNYDEPLPLDAADDEGSLDNTRKLFKYLVRRDGLKIEKVRLGATDQLAPMREPASCAEFKVQNICANGKILCKDGSIRDLYAEKIAREHPKRVNENGMSLGMIISYGAFKLFTAGDFNDGWKQPDGSRFDIETEFAKELTAVDVAHVNHHGYHSTPLALSAVLRPRVWISGIWDQLHNTPDSLERMTSREAYPGDRLLAPGIFPAERRWQDQGKPFMRDFAKESFDGGHVIIDVPSGGKTYSLSYLTADDESMKVTGVYHFNK